MGRVAFTIIFILLCNPITAWATERFEFEKTGKATWEVKTQEKIIAITFDDGPNREYTPDILDVLAKHHAKATFFVVGAHAERYPELIHREVLEGHEIGNHTFNHRSILRNSNKLDEEIKKTADIIKQITGISPTLFRPVAGNYNSTIINTAAENGHHVVIWSWHQDPVDWRNPGVSRITKKVTTGIQPGNIILLHDSGGDRSQTVEALDRILTILEKEGYKFVTVSDMLARQEIKQNELLKIFLQ